MENVIHLKLGSIRRKVYLLKVVEKIVYINWITELNIPLLIKPPRRRAFFFLLQPAAAVSSSAAVVAAASAHSSSSFYETFRKHEQQGIFIFPRYTTPPLPLLPETGRCGEYFVLFSRRNNSKSRLQYCSIPFAQTFLTLR